MTTNTVERENDFWGKVRPLVLKTVIGAVVAAALVGLFAVIVGEFNTLHLKMLFTIVIFVAFSMFAWYDADVSSRRSHTFALIGVGVSLYLLFVGFFKVWLADLLPSAAEQYSYPGSESWETVEHFGQWIWLAIIARVALLHAHLLLNIHRRYPTPALQMVAKVTFVFIVLLAILLSLPTLFDNYDQYGEMYWRLTWAVAILDLLGTVLIPLSNALFGPKKEVMGANLYSTTAASTPGTVAAPAPVQQPKRLAWPRYEDGTPLPAKEDGTPDYSVLG